MEHLESQQTFACGTVRINRKGIPPCAKQKLKPGKKVMQQKGKHFIEKIHGRKKECVQCKKRGRKTPKDRPIESSFECLQFSAE
ncbi:hypothetical protein QZH41_005212 [Actinostola sp. cb2023]|nr:hypothetical protein QZH41_005212 [Actinostola sp. cb2023]